MGERLRLSSFCEAVLLLCPGQPSPSPSSPLETGSAFRPGGWEGCPSGLSASQALGSLGRPFPGAVQVKALHSVVPDRARGVLRTGGTLTKPPENRPSHPHPHPKLLPLDRREAQV